MVGKALFLFTMRLSQSPFPFVNWREVTQFLPHAHIPWRKWVLLREVVWIKGYWHSTKKRGENNSIQAFNWILSEGLPDECNARKLYLQLFITVSLSEKLPSYLCCYLSNVSQHLRLGPHIQDIVCHCQVCK